MFNSYNIAFTESNGCQIGCCFTRFTTFKWLNLPGVSGLKRFLTIESSLKVIKNTFYFMLKALFFLEISTFLSWLFGYFEKWLDKKAMVNFEIYDIADCKTNNSIHILPNI